jgi:transcriptional regulator with GAF, ATPase, and Fis domain
VAGLEHAAWVVSEVAVLLVACGRSIEAMQDTADRTAAALEQDVARASRRSASSLTAAVGFAVTHGTSLGDMLQECADGQVTHMEGGFARIWTLDQSGQTLEMKASAGTNLSLDARHARVTVGLYTIGAIAEARKPRLVPAADVDLPTGDPGWVRRERLVAFAGYPLLVDSKLVGVLAMFSPREFSRSTTDAMAVVASAVALGVVRKRTEREGARSEPELKSATRAQGVFPPRVSHELATPLNALLALTHQA